MLASQSFSAKVELQKTNLNKGARAPFSGILLSRPALAKIISEYDGKLKQKDLLLETQRKSFEARLASNATQCTIRLSTCVNQAKNAAESHRQILGVYTGALDKLRSPPWYTAPSLNQALGCMVCGGLCVGITAAVNK